MAMVFGVAEAPARGWGSSSTLGFIIGGLALLALFVAVELRSKNPLVPFGIFKIRNVLGVNLAMIPIIAGVFRSFFFSSLYMQGVLGHTPTLTGLALLVTPAFIMIVGSQVPRLLRAWGYKPILFVASVIIALSQLLLASGATYPFPLPLSRSSIGCRFSTQMAPCRIPACCASRGIVPSGGSVCPNTIRTTCDTSGPP
jgi:predicted MFS family arabinose efflux permease